MSSTVFTGKTQRDRMENTEAIKIVFKAQLKKNLEQKEVVNLYEQGSINTVTKATGIIGCFAKQKASGRSGFLEKALAKPRKSGEKAKEQGEDAAGSGEASETRQGAVKKTQNFARNNV